MNPFILNIGRICDSFLTIGICQGWWNITAVIMLPDKYIVHILYMYTQGLIYLSTNHSIYYLLIFALLTCTGERALDGWLCRSQMTCCIRAYGQGQVARTWESPLSESQQTNEESELCSRKEDRNGSFTSRVSEQTTVPAEPWVAAGELLNQKIQVKCDT